MNIAILLAAGSGERFGGDKIFAKLQGKAVIEWSLKTLSSSKEIHGIIIVGKKETQKKLSELANRFPKVLAVIQGGNSRFQSSTFGAMEAKKWGAEILLFHNAANPLMTEKELDEVIDAAEKKGASGVGQPVHSTLRHSTKGIIPREEVWAMETPQAIRATLFWQGVETCIGEPTDDLTLAEAAGITPGLIMKSKQNQKITTREDLELLEMYLHRKSITSIGQDSHAFDETGTLRLGGIDIPTAPKLKGNSDGDAVLHALCNALSSSIGEGSLSTFSDEMCKKGITDSAAYLRHILATVREKGGEIEHLSIGIEGKRPKFESHRKAMQKRISEICETKEEQIGITCTTGEELTAFGRGEGIQVLALATVSFPGSK